MRNALPLLLVLLAGSVPALAEAQPDPDVGRLFSHQARVTQLGAQSYRLPLSPEVLAICRPDLSDVRLFDGAGAEIPWMLDSATRTSDPTLEELVPRAAPILATPTHTLERSPTIPLDFHEVYDVAAPGDPPSRAAWDLALYTPRDHFVVDVRVTALDGTDRELGHGTAYRFLAPMRELVRVPITTPGASRVRVDIRGHEGFLEPVMTWVATRRTRAAEELVVPLTIVSTAHEGTQTVLTLERPEGVVPEALRFATTTTAFVRPIHVDAAGRSIDSLVWRVPGDRGAEVLDVRAPAARGPTMVVRIDDQDSPALADLTVSAVLSQPVLVYFQPAEMLRFGGGRVRAPHYDLAMLQGGWQIDQLLDGSSTPLDATLGPIEPSPGWTSEPALSFLHRAGTTVPEGDHAFVAPLEVTAATEGASRFVLDAAVLAAARDDLADLRIVDGEGRQWPYLMREADPLVLPVTLGAPARDGDETRYDVTLPGTRVIASELRLDPDARLVSRAVRFVGTDGRGDETALGSAFLDRSFDGDATPLTLSISPIRVSTLAFFVRDGSETPLAFRSASIVLPTHEIVLVAPPGSYRVLVGDDDAHAPVYEIERARALLDTIPLDEATLGALAPSPTHHEPTFWERTGTSTLLLWAVLSLAIVVLGGLTWRASRMPETEPAKQKAEPSA